jgi:DUF438 domain-containing protein
MDGDNYKRRNKMLTIEQLKQENKDLATENLRLNNQILFIKKQDEELKQRILSGLNELNTIGFIHGVGSKERATNIIIAALKDRFGFNWKN